MSLRQDPYRLFFPIGGLLLVWAIWPWVAFGLWAGPYLSIFHSLVVIEGFLTAFAIGFLFTFVPRRTQGAPPSTFELVAGAVLPIAVTASAWLQQWALSQALWIALMLLLVRFVLARILRGPGFSGLPSGMVWIPASITMGICGAAMTALAASVGAAVPWLHSAGQALLTQGMFTGLGLGVSTVLFPIIAWGTPPRAGKDMAWALHLSAAILFALTFFLEARMPLQLVWTLRAAITLALVLGAIRAWRVPTLPGLHRWLLWSAVWLIPAGYVLMAAFPARRLMGEHVLFIGGFGLMVIAISAHVTFAHGGHLALLTGRPWRLVVGAALVALAILFRALMVWQPWHLRLWAALASITFLCAAACWLHLILTHLRPKSPESINPDEATAARAR